MMEHDKKLIEKIAIEVQTEYQMGGLSDGLYLEFATDVAIRYAKEVSSRTDVIKSFCVDCGEEIQMQIRCVACKIGTHG